MTSSSRESSIPLGSYQLCEQIGEGGTAHVHRGVAPDGRRVAIKLLAPQAEFDQPSARARFEREIRILSSVRDPHLIELIDHGVDPELGPYLVMPEVTGKTLRELVGEGRLCPEAVALLLWPLLGAVEALHAVGLVHRDLKPENLMMSAEGQLVLVDLGLAYGPGHTRYTDEGAVVGSVPYMSPEQVEGRLVAAASDLWAIGVMAYEWLTGRRPFARERPAEEAAALLVGAFEPLAVADRRVSPELAALVSDLLEHDPAARPSAGAARERVRALIDFTELPAGAELERAALFRDPVGYQARIARFRVDRLRGEAAAAIAAGESFRALAAIDRGLAYAPGDAELLVLSERAEQVGGAALGAERATEVESAKVQPRIRGRRVALAAIGILAVAGIVAGIAWRDDGAPDRPAAPSLATATETTATAARTSDDQNLDTALQLMGGMVQLLDQQAQKGGLQVRSEGDPEQARLALSLFGGMVDLVSRQVEADRAAGGAAGSEPPADRPAAAATDSTATSPLVLVPIPTEALADRPVASDLDLAAAPGEPLVPVDLLGGLDPDQTAAAYDREVESHPDDPDWAVGRALVYLAAGRREKGLRLLDSLPVRYPHSPGVWAAKGYVALRRGQYAEGEAAFDRALELDPKDGQSLRNRGILRHRQGKQRAAYRDLTAALEQHPGDTEAMSELARIYEEAGRRPDARPLLERIVALHPDSPVGWMDLALVQSPRQALASVERALALAPDQPVILTRVCELRRQLEPERAVVPCARACELGVTAACSETGP